MTQPRITLVAAAVLLLPPATAASAADGLVLKRVLLSTGGVGYFEHEASVVGDAALTLEVRRDQVDDVLKSIVVYDDRGRVGTISLPGEEPLAAVFRDLPFSEGDLASPAALLTALRGAEVEAMGGREVEGRILSVREETVALPNGGGTVTRHRVSLMTADGVSQFILEEADALRFADPRLQEQVDRALAALARHGRRERRALTIHAPGEGQRTVRVGYVVEAPLWKATYRLTLPANGAKADLQGWAVLENLSGEDWRGVDLTVLSGAPVTFRQALYAPYFVERPEAPVEVAGRVLPKPDTGVVDLSEAAGAAMPESMPQTLAAPAPPAGRKAMAAEAPPQIAEPVAAEAAEAATQVVFRYPLPVTLPDGGSLMMPIVARAAPAQPVALYQPATHPRHPLASVRLVNDGDAGLPPGVLTLYERTGQGVSYVGDARLAPLPSGEERLLSFAVDQKVVVDRREDPERVVTGGAIADGVLRLSIRERQTTAYTIKGAAREPRAVVLEHPRRPGWELVPLDGPRPQVTDTAYRIPVDVPAGKTASLSVTLERPRVERLQILDLPLDRVEVYASSPELPDAIRAALARTAELRAAVARREETVADLERRRAEVVEEQARLRVNLESLPDDSDLHRRTLAKMGEAETRLETLAERLGEARAALDEARRALADHVGGLRIGTG